MKFIEKILKKSYNKKYKINIILIFTFLSMILCSILSYFKVEGLPVLIACLLIFLLYLICQFYYRKRYNNEFDFNRTKMYKELVKKGYLAEFINTIDSEINSEKTIKYYNDIYETGLLITETWFVFISSMNPKIRKTSEIYKITESIDNFSKILCSIQFKDNSYFNTKYIEFDEIKRKIKEKYPSIYIDS